MKSTIKGKPIKRAKTGGGSRTKRLLPPAFTPPSADLIGTSTGPLPSTIDRKGRVAIWRQITQDIEARIRCGLLKPGTRLPTESELASHYGVNRHTLRRALAELGQQALVTATPRRGTFVASTRISHPIGAKTHVSRSVTNAGLAPAGRLIDARRVAAPDDISQQLMLGASECVICMRHVRLADTTPICFATAWFPARRFARIPELYKRHGSVARSLEQLGVANFRRLRTRITAQSASPEERLVLDLPRGALLIVTDGIDVDEDNVPVQVSHSCFAADRIELVVES